MAEVVKVEIAVDGKDSGKKVKDLKKDLQGTEQEAKKASNSIKGIGTEGQSVKMRLRELKDEMSAMANQGSPEFQKLAAEAGKLKDQMNNANAAIKTMSSDFPKLQVGIQAFQGIGAAAQFAAGAQLLLGEENKEIAKAMQRAMALTTMMTAVQQIANTVSDEAALGIKLRALNQKFLNRETVAQAVATGTATKAQKLMNLAMKANPIGLIIVAVTALITGIVALAKNVKKVGDFFNWLTDVIVDNFTAQMKFLGILDKEFETIGQRERRLREQKAAARKEEAEEHKARIKEINEERDTFIEATNDTIKALELEKETLDAEGKTSAEVTEQILEAELAKQQAVFDANAAKIQSYITYYQNLAALNGQSEEEFIASQKAQGVDLELLLQKANDVLQENSDNIQRAENNITKFRREQAEKRAGDVKAGVDEEKKVRDAALKAEEDRIKREAKIHNDFLAEKEKLENEFFDSQLTKQQQEINAVEDKYFRLIELAEQFGEDTTVLEAARQQALFEVNEEFRLQEEELQTELDEQKEQKRLNDLELAKEAREENIQAATESAETLLSIAKSFNSIANDRDIKRIKDKQSRGEKLTNGEIKRLERQEKVQKAFAVAQIAIDTARGISAAVAAGAGLIFPANIPAILSGVAAVVGGVAQANAILGESSNVDIGSITDVGNGASAVTDNAQAPLRTIESGSTLLNPEPQVVVVVEDINQGQNSVAVIESQASFG